MRVRRSISLSALLCSDDSSGDASRSMKASCCHLRNASQALSQNSTRSFAAWLAVDQDCDCGASVEVAAPFMGPKMALNTMQSKAAAAWRTNVCGISPANYFWDRLKVRSD